MWPEPLATRREASPRDCSGSQSCSTSSSTRCFPEHTGTPALVAARRLRVSTWLAPVKRAQSPLRLASRVSRKCLDWTVSRRKPDEVVQKLYGDCVINTREGKNERDA